MIIGMDSQFYYPQPMEGSFHGQGEDPFFNSTYNQARANQLNSSGYQQQQQFIMVGMPPSFSGRASFDKSEPRTAPPKEGNFDHYDQ
mmetsp:Transcript_26228/g.19704  ORF Transcript_26228/g.19704 Transcript_26228/m.19704 type:complete len:87 (+) Transcript_26228:482-742(+)